MTGFTGVARSQTYSLWLHSVEVTVNVFDYGEDMGNTRFAVEAFESSLPEEDRDNASDAYTVGQPASTVRDALTEANFAKLATLFAERE